MLVLVLTLNRNLYSDNIFIVLYFLYFTLVHETKKNILFWSGFRHT